MRKIPLFYFSLLPVITSTALVTLFTTSCGKEEGPKNSIEFKSASGDKAFKLSIFGFDNYESIDQPIDDSEVYFDFYTKNSSNEWVTYEGTTCLVEASYVNSPYEYLEIDTSTTGNAALDGHAFGIIYKNAASLLAAGKYEVSITVYDSDSTIAKGTMGIMFKR
ncbi:MAG: hypothetical protein Ta2E_08660 [Mycoplasmoidaceae bacterium]|nr:MAG: hypothetical protein Ta2E_08660 [Mycoplasmoidaceae bacterium]